MAGSRTTISAHRIRLTLVMLVMTMIAPTTALAGDDSGLMMSIGAEKGFGKRFSLSTEAEFRSRNDFRTADRWSIELTGEYKLLSWLKASAGYILIHDNNVENLTYNLDGEYNNWTPSYWGWRHRTHLTLNGSVKLGRVKFSLRERWQYTYRPGVDTERFDFDMLCWEEDHVRGKGANVLRSRLRAEWDLPKSKFTPWADVEMYNNWAVDKVRYTIGSSWKLNKKNVFKLYYRYQQINNASDEDPNRHYIGVGYNYKF